MSSYSLIVVALCVGVCYASLPLPSYMKKCARSDPGFDACTKQSAQDTIQHIVSGDRKYKIPAIDPLEITEITAINEGPKQAGIDITMKNVKLHGLKDTTFQAVKINYDKKTVHIELLHKRIELLGNYEISGRILLLPISGKGPCNITLEDITAQFDSDWIVQKKDGSEFMALKNYRLTNLQPKKVHYILENLFNGDKLLGPEMNNVLNENWKDAFKELSPPLVKGISEAIASIINNVASLVEYENIFPLKV